MSRSKYLSYLSNTQIHMSRYRHLHTTHEHGKYYYIRCRLRVQCTPPTPAATSSTLPTLSPPLSNTRQCMYMPPLSSHIETSLPQNTRTRYSKQESRCFTKFSAGRSLTGSQPHRHPPRQTGCIYLYCMRQAPGTRPVEELPPPRTTVVAEGEQARDGRALVPS